MILPEGITGFRQDGDASMIHKITPVIFARTCHLACRLGGWRVEKLDPANYPRNHHRAIIRLCDNVLLILCNVDFPIIAFAKVSDGLHYRFVEDTALASCFQEALCCEVLSLRSLEERPDAESLASLSVVERQQVRYWRPQRLGDIIFNSWD